MSEDFMVEDDQPTERIRGELVSNLVKTPSYPYPVRAGIIEAYQRDALIFTVV